MAELNPAYLEKLKCGKLLPSNYGVVKKISEVLGLVPEDPSVVLAAAAGRLLIDFTEQGAARACRNLALRLEGRRVALMKLK